MTECPKCNRTSGDGWSHCPRNYGCPMEASPWHESKKPTWPEEFADLVVKAGLREGTIDDLLNVSVDDYEESEPLPEPTLRSDLIDIIGKYAVRCEYYHDYYFMDGKIQNDCPNQEELLKIIQDNCRNLSDDIGAILDKYLKDSDND
jgi:hypothetical protein